MLTYAHTVLYNTIVEQLNSWIATSWPKLKIAKGQSLKTRNNQNAYTMSNMASLEGNIVIQIVIKHGSNQT